MTSVRLALRGLASRLGLTLSLLAVTVFAVGVASAGAMYLRAAGESALQASLRSVPPFAAGVQVHQRVAAKRTLRSIDGSLRGVLPAFPELAAPAAGFETSDALPLAAPAYRGEPQRAKLTARDGACTHLLLVAGACPRPTTIDLPAQAVASEQVAAKLHLALGDLFDAKGLAAGETPRRLRLVGIYRADPSNPWFYGHDLFYNPLNATDEAEAPLDAVWVDPGDLRAAIGSAIDVRATWDIALQAGKVRLRDAAELARAERSVEEQLHVLYPAITTNSSLERLVGDADSGRRALTVPVLLATIQLLALGLLILMVVAAMAAEARTGEVALAKVRGATTGQAFSLATLELSLVAVAAVPLGLALGWLGTLLVGRTQFAGGVPVVATPIALAVALAAGLGALAAAAAAGFGSVRRRVLDQWRQARSDRAGRRSALLEAVLLAVAAAALLNLRVGGARRGGGYDPLAVLAPAMVVLAGALVAGRLLPPAAGMVVRLTTRSRRLAAYIGARQVARRGGAALRVVVALAAAFGLVAFAITVRQDLLRNRHDRAMTETGAARRATVSFAGGFGTETVTAADPGGRAAMAALQYSGTLGTSSNATILGVQARRYARVGFWRGDFAARPLAKLLAPLERPSRPPLDLGDAGAVEVEVEVPQLRAAGPLTLVAGLRATGGGTANVPLGQLRQGPARPYRGVLDPAKLRLDGPWQLQRLYLERGLGRFFQVDAEVVFHALRVRQAGRWREVAAFGDQDAWASLNQGDFEPADELRVLASAGGKALADHIQAPSYAGNLGLSYGSLPVEIPTVVTPGLLAAQSAVVGEVVTVQAPGTTGGNLRLRITGVARVLPGTEGADRAALVDLDALIGQALRDPSAQPAANQVWLAPGPAGEQALARLRGHGAQVLSVDSAAARERELAGQAPSLAVLLLVVGASAGALLATGGVMLHLYLTGRRRGFELAVLDALGARRRDLWAPVAVEQGSLVGYGVLVGGAIGLAAALVALPAIPQFVDHPDVPPPIYTPDWATLGGALGLALLLVGGGLAMVVAGLVRAARPELLREEEL